MATAGTAPIIPAAFFPTKGSVFGLAAAGELLMGAPSGGGLVSTSAPTLAAATIHDTSEGEPAGLTVVNGGLAVQAGGIAVQGGAAFTGPGNMTFDAGTSVDMGGGGLNLGTDGGGVPGLATNAATLSVTFSAEGGGALRLVNSVAANAADVVTKGYVDSVASGLDIKASAVAKSGASLTASAAYAAGTWESKENELIPDALFDGVELGLGDRVLVDQVGSGSAAGGGLFEVTSVGGAGARWALARTADADSTTKVTPGMFVFVTTGTSAGDRGYVLTTDLVSDLDTDTLVFTQFTSASAPVPGEDTQLIFNDGGVLAGSSKAVFSKTSGDLTLSTGSVAVDLGDVTVSVGDVTVEAGSVRAASIRPPGSGETISMKALPVVESGSVAGSTATSAGLAAPMTVIATLPFDGLQAESGAGAGRARKVTIPAGTQFFPLGAEAWCSSITTGGSDHGAVVTLTAKVGATEVAKVVMNQPNFGGTGPGRGAARLQWSTTQNTGIGGEEDVDIDVLVGVEGDSSDAFELRFGLIGFLVKNEPAV
jgi:hypothetical protein